ncbi:MAG: lipopolysaccharide heptosyltransferase II [Deltaproteobacteria bacterium]|jgi:heptosyltransferase-2|nr:lipopolysaccharide heptosyltransferase II [Deltaproteobacteria bacterium]
MTIKMPLFEAPGPLLIRGLNWLGDAVMSIPAIKAIKNYYPSRELLAITRASTADVYDSLNVFSKVLIENLRFSSRLKLAKIIRTLSPTGMLILPNSFSTALMAKLSGARVRVGSAKNMRSVFLTKAVKFLPEEEAAHESFKFLRLVEELGLPSPFTKPLLDKPLLDKPKLPYDEFLPQGFRLAIAPGAAFGSAKCWPTDNFAEAAKLILQDRKGTVLILGGPAECDTAKELEAKLSGGPEVINMAGRTKIKEVISILADCHLTLANDSGLMHLSGAVGVPVVAVFGPTNPIKTAPLASRCIVLRRPAPCSPCRHRECPKPRRICFDQLTPEMAAEAANKLIGPVRQDRPTVIWSPLSGQIWPFEHGSDIRFCALATDIVKAGGQLSSAPPWLTVISRPMDGANDWRDYLHEGNLDPNSTFWLGDTANSINLAKTLGGRSILVTTDRGRAAIPELLAGEGLPNIAVPNFTRAMEWIASF